MTGRLPPIGEDFPRLRAIVERAMHDIGMSDLRDTEVTFVLDMERRLSRYRENTWLSRRQIHWLEDIDARLARDEPDADGLDFSRLPGGMIRWRE